MNVSNKVPTIIIYIILLHDLSCIKMNAIRILLLLIVASLVHISFPIKVVDVHTPVADCEVFAKHSDHLLLEFVLAIDGREDPIDFRKAPANLFYLRLSPSHDHLMLKGLCIGAVREITWESFKGIQLQPFLVKDIEEEVDSPITLTVTLHHVTSNEDFAIFEPFIQRNDSAVLQLLSNRTGVNAYDEWGNTMLMLATQKGHINIVAALLNTRRPSVEINAAKSNGFTALYYSISLKSEGILLALLRRGADPNLAIQQEESKGNTALHLACALEKLKHAEVLLAYGADPLLRNAQNLTPLDTVPHDAVYSLKTDFKRIIEAAVRAKKATHAKTEL